jgi:hypothetical protein
MNAPASFNNPFFITRPSANLMEDLHRQISTAGAICLLYGVEGVGKTRLIRQFISTRLAGRKVKFCRLDTDGFFLDDDSQLHAFDSLMQTLLDSPSSNTIWVIDQLELASGTFIQQLLQFWSLHATKLNCALILGCRPRYLGTVYKISQQLKLKIPSVELKPLSKSESLQYLSAQLCPDTDSVALLSRELSKEFKVACGVPGLLDQIIQQHAGLIECRPKTLHNRKVKILLLLAASILIFSPGIYLNMSKFDFIEKQATLLTDAVKGDEPQRQEIKQTEKSVISGLVEPVILEREALITVDKEAEQVVSAEHTGSPLQEEAEAVDRVAIENKEIEQIPKPQNVLMERLSATDEWLQLSSDETASIQIMSLVLGEELQNSLLVFLRRLATDGINLQQIYIYEMNKAGDHIYVVLFGSYADRSEARKKINALPSPLKANSPIVRTVLGIKNEIEEGEN